MHYGLPLKKLHVMRILKNHDFSQLSSIHPRIKECLMGQHCKNDPDEFMSCRQHSHFVRQSILGPLQVVLFESFVELDDPRCQQPDGRSPYSS